MTQPASININRRPVLDLEYRHFETTVGNILVIGTWVMDEETRRHKPAMVLIDATKRLKRRNVVPCIIPMSEAWRWSIELGEPDHVWPIIRRWIREGALPGNPMNDRDLWAVFDAVQSRLRDLIYMPPMPAAGAIKYGSTPDHVGVVTIRNESSGEVLHQAEVVGNVRD